MLPGGTAAAWHAIGAADAAALVGTDGQRGLAASEALERRRRSGPNLVSVRPARPLWRLALSQFHAPLVYLLLIAGAVTLALGDPVGGAVILGVVAVNGAVGFVQERRAAGAIDALARSMPTSARVIREGTRCHVDASELVVGDVVAIEPGDRVPADIRIVTQRELRIDESMLTGESAPVAKGTAPLAASTPLAERACMAHAGTLAVRGSATGIVVAVGDCTETGRIGRMVAAAREAQTPLTRKIRAFSRLLLWAVLAIAALAFAIGVMRGEPASDMFTAAVALAVAAIPEGLPAAITVMLAVGVSRMAARRAVIRRLPAVEALGSVTVICSDKTGTLTRNEMTVARLHAGGRTYSLPRTEGTGNARVAWEGHAIEVRDHPALIEALMTSVLCSDACTVRGADGRDGVGGDPTEAALVLAAERADPGMPSRARESMPRVDAIPFDPDRQWMATLHRAPDGSHEVRVKGALERVLSMCRHGGMRDALGRSVPLDPHSVHAAAAEMSHSGMRMLAMAGGPWRGTSLDEQELLSGHLSLHGIAGMLDPPREEATRAVGACASAGIRVKMVTGDHAMTAASIARMMGIGGSSPAVLTSAEIAAMDDGQLAEAAERTDVFARATPEQKLRLVRALQARGHVVAMTGDGVNDAPALRQADIGVAMGLSGTEVAKDSADMVLADDNFATIEAAIEEGRSVYSNLAKFIAWTIPTNIGEALVIVAAIALAWPLPILPVQALYVNMFTSVLLGIPLVWERTDPDAMRRPPRNPSRPLMTMELAMRSALMSLLLCAGAMWAFHLELPRIGEHAARTAAVSVIVAGEMAYLFSARSLLRPAWSVPLRSNPPLWAGIAAMALVQCAFAHWPVAHALFRSAPLDGQAWLRVAGIALAMVSVVEAEKAIRRWLGADAGSDTA